MSTDEETQSKTATTFVDRKTIGSFAGASASLTVLMNVTMILYSQFKNTPMPNSVLGGLGIVLCLGYSLSFLKKGPAINITEYIWLTALNSAILFSSLTGLNNILKKAGDQYTNQNIQTTQTKGKSNSITSVKQFKGNILESSFAIGDLKNIIFPKQTWVSPPRQADSFEVKKAKIQAKQITGQALIAVTKTNIAFSKAIVTQKSSDKKGDSLSTALNELRTQYIKNLSQLGSYESTISGLNEKLNACGAATPAVTKNINELQNAIISSKNQQQQQVIQQQQQQQLHVQRQQLQIKVQQQMNVQQMQIQQVKQQLQQVQMQQ
jgi:hypothetical protein